MASGKPSGELWEAALEEKVWNWTDPGSLGQPRMNFWPQFSEILASEETSAGAGMAKPVVELNGLSTSGAAKVGAVTADVMKPLAELD